MDLKKFENIFIKNNYTHDYYNMIFSLLSKENADIELNEREYLFNVIKNEQFYNYSYTWHLSEYFEPGFIGNLKSISTFHSVNKDLHNNPDYFTFLKNDLFPIFQEESNNYFTKGLMIHKDYDEYTESSKETIIKFLSPLDIYNILTKNELFNDIKDNFIIENLIIFENENLNNKNPVIEEGLQIMKASFNDPNYFENFISFWAKYKKLLLNTNSLENDLKIVSEVNPQMYDKYTAYMGTPGINYELDKSILSKEVTKFYFTHFDEFVSHSGKIPNPLVWIYESKKFLETQNFINNISNQQFEYLKNFNKSSYFRKFISEVLFSQRFEKDISYPAVKNLLSKNFDFENLFYNFEVNNPVSTELSNFENYILELSNSLKEKDLLPFYRANKLEDKLSIKNNKIKTHKI